MSKNSLGTLTLDLIVQTGGFESGLDKAERLADQKTRRIEQQARERAKAIESAFGSMARSMAAPLAGAALGLGGIASLNALKSSIESTIRGFADLKTAAERTGASVANLSGLKSVAKIGDHDFAIVESALVRLNKALHGTDDESKGAGKALAALGLDLKALRELDPADAMLALAKAQEKFADGGGKSAAMIAILGKSGAEAIPYLKDLAEQGKLVGKVTAEQAKAADDYEKNVKRLQGSWNTLSKQLAAAAVGPAKDITDWMVKAQKEGGTLEAVFTGLGMAMAKAFGVEINPEKRADAQVNDLFRQRIELLNGIKAKQAELDADKGGILGKLITDKQLAGMKSDLADVEKQLKSAIGLRNKFLQKAADENAPKDTSLNSQNFGSDGKDKTKTEKVYEPLAESAKTYGETLKTLFKAQRDADTSGLNLTNTQRQMLDVMSSPEWLQMPDSWKAIITEQAKFAEHAEIAAEAQKRLNDLLSATPTGQLEKSRNTMEFLAKAFEDGKISAEQFSEAATTALHGVAEKAKETKSFAEEMGLTFTSAFEDAVVSGKSLSTVLQSLIQDMAKAALRKGVTEPLGEAFTGFLKSTFSTSTPKANAMGGVYTSPSLHSYVNQVHDTPKLFAFAQGAVFAEAGPEAIMPLSRGSDGKLGVMSHGGGMSVEIHNYTGQAVQQREVADGRGGRKLEVTIGDIVAGQLKTPGSASNMALRSPRMIRR